MTEVTKENEATTAALEARYEDLDRSFSDGVEIEPEAQKPAAKHAVKKES